jgi:CRISPR-associated protein Cmr5
MPNYDKLLGLNKHKQSAQPAAAVTRPPQQQKSEITMSSSSTRLTLEQQRSKNAWDVSANYNDDAVKLAKGLPALIMNSGLMQVIAFCHHKGGKHEEVASDLRKWLAQRFPSVIGNSGFNPFMESLMGASPGDYQAINSEAFAWLKWLRQMGAARVKTGGT